MARFVSSLLPIWLLVLFTMGCDESSSASDSFEPTYLGGTADQSSVAAGTPSSMTSVDDSAGVMPTDVAQPPSMEAPNSSTTPASAGSDAVAPPASGGNVDVPEAGGSNIIAGTLSMLGGVSDEPEADPPGQGSGSEVPLGGGGADGATSDMPVLPQGRIVIDGVNDFPASARHETTSPDYVGYAFADDIYLYFGMEGPDVNQGDGSRFLTVYIDGAPSSRTQEGLLNNTQTPQLSFEAGYAIRWKNNNDTTEGFFVENGDWAATDWDFEGLVFQAGPFVEFKVPLTWLGITGAAEEIHFHMSMLNATDGSEWTFAGVPNSSFADGYDPNFQSHLTLSAQDVSSDVRGGAEGFDSGGTETGGTDSSQGGHQTGGSPSSGGIGSNFGGMNGGHVDANLHLFGGGTSGGAHMGGTASSGGMMSGGTSTEIGGGQSAGGLDNLGGQIAIAGTEENAVDPYVHSIVIDGLNDFDAGAESLATSSSASGYIGFVAWDQTYVYFGLEGPDIASNDPFKSLFIYFDGDVDEYNQVGIASGTQVPNLAFSAGHGFRWRASGDSSAMHVEQGNWKPNTEYDFTGDIYQNGSYIEFRFAFTDLGYAAPPQVLLMSAFMVNESPGGEWVYAGLPSVSFVDGAGVDAGSYYAFGTTGDRAPAWHSPQSGT